MKSNPTPSVVGRRPRSNLFLLKSVWLLALALALQPVHAAFTLPLYEPFAYTNFEALGVGSATVGGSFTNWGWGNTPGGSSAHITNTAALSYPGMPLDPNTSDPLTPRGLLSNNGTGKNRGANFTTPVTNVTLYASFMLNLMSNAVTSADRPFFALSSYSYG
jgi:hypothetical protein